LLKGQAASSPSREYYELRKYQLTIGPQTRLIESYFADALIPVLNRLGLAPIGAFYLDIGPETPALYLLIPGSALPTLVTAELQLANDAAFLKAAEPFWNAPAVQPPFTRIESSLMIAFEGWPKLKLPLSSAQHTKRIFQLRIYESPTNQDHLRKIEMFHHGEFEFFAKAGCEQIFYGDTLIGPRLPNLTYMLSFSDMQALETGWAAFNADPGWQKLKASPRYAFEPIVSNITSLVLKPTSFSQI
jgi:NIPSNAP